MMKARVPGWGGVVEGDSAFPLIRPSVHPSRPILLPIHLSILETELPRRGGDDEREGTTRHDTHPFPSTSQPASLYPLPSPNPLTPPLPRFLRGKQA